MHIASMLSPKTIDKIKQTAKFTVGIIVSAAVFTALLRSMSGLTPGGQVALIIFMVVYAVIGVGTVCGMVMVTAFKKKPDTTEPDVAAAKPTKLDMLFWFFLWPFCIGLNIALDNYLKVAKCRQIWRERYEQINPRPGCECDRCVYLRGRQDGNSKPNTKRKAH